jgi:hypothetical protein
MSLSSCAVSLHQRVSFPSANEELVFYHQVIQAQQVGRELPPTYPLLRAYLIQRMFAEVPGPHGGRPVVGKFVITNLSRTLRTTLQPTGSRPSSSQADDDGNIGAWTRKNGAGTMIDTYEARYACSG